MNRPDSTSKRGASSNLPSGELGLLDRLVGFNLRIGYNRAVGLFSRAFDQVELAPIQFAALEYIANNPDCSQKEMASDIGSSAAALVSPLERLERQGWIARHRIEADRRRARINLTPAGAAVLDEAKKRVRDVDRKLVSDLTRRERDQLLLLLRKISGREPTPIPKSRKDS